MKPDLGLLQFQHEINVVRHEVVSVAGLLIEPLIKSGAFAVTQYAA